MDARRRTRPTAGRLDPRCAVTPIGLPRRDTRRPRAGTSPLARRSGARPRRRDGAVATRRRLRSADARARTDPQAGGGGSGGRRRDRCARRSRGAGHVRRTWLARVLQGPLRRGRGVAGRGRSDGIRRRFLGCLPRRQVPGLGTGVGSKAGNRRRRCAPDRKSDLTAAVRTASGTYVVDVDAEEVIGAGDDFEPPRVTVELPRVVAAAVAGATVVAVVDRRPPLAISNDAGRTWREAGGGLPAGFAVAIDENAPDVMLFAARNRLYLSENGGIFWRVLVPELPEIEAVTFLYDSSKSLPLWGVRRSYVTVSDTGTWLGVTRGETV